MAPRTYYLRIFLICLLVVVVCLVGFLFGVRMEAVVPATGIIQARAQQDFRSPLTGLVEPGWHEAEVPSGSATLRVRLDSQGNGTTDPRTGPALPVRSWKLSDGRGLDQLTLRFHRLQPGDELWPGQVLAEVRTDELLPRRAILRVPDTGDLWLALRVRVDRGQRTTAGDILATLAPLDPATRRPRHLIAHLDIDEKHLGDIAPGQTVRIYSTMFNPRHHGHATAVIDRIEPWGKAAGATRQFHALAPLEDSPDLSLPLGSTFKAEIIVGRKPMYRIILEH
jgi:hypothetical protein